MAALRGGIRETVNQSNFNALSSPQKMTVPIGRGKRGCLLHSSPGEIANFA
jgi:hypothetical protein